MSAYASSSPSSLFISILSSPSAASSSSTTASLVTSTDGSLLSHHSHGHHGGNVQRRRDYEFSYSNSPDPAASFSASRRRLAYFPSCLGMGVEEQDSLADVASSPAPLARIEYCAATAASLALSSPGLLLRELAPGEECCASPALGAGEGFSVRVSNYSSEEEGSGSEAVDDEAEEFILRFYEQLRHHNTIALLPYLQESTAGPPPSPPRGAASPRCSRTAPLGEIAVLPRDRCPRLCGVPRSCGEPPRCSRTVPPCCRAAWGAAVPSYRMESVAPPSGGRDRRGKMTY